MRGHKLLLTCLFASAAVAIPVSSPADGNAAPVDPAGVAVVPVVAKPASIQSPNIGSATSVSDLDISSPEDEDVNIDDGAEINTAVAQAKSSTSDIEEVESHIDQYEGDVQNFLRTIEKDIREQLDKKYAAKYAASEAQRKADYEKAKKDLGNKCIVEKSTSSSVETKDGTSETINTSTQAEIDGKKKKKRKIIVNVTNTNTQGDQTFNGNAGAGSGSGSDAAVSTGSPYSSLISTGVSGVAYGAGAGAAYALIRNRDNPAKPSVKEPPAVKEPPMVKKPTTIVKQATTVKNSDQDVLNDIMGSDAVKKIDITRLNPTILRSSSSVSENEIQTIAKEFGMTADEIKEAFTAEERFQSMAEDVNRKLTEALKTPGISTEEAMNKAIDEEAVEQQIKPEGVMTQLKGWFLTLINKGDWSRVDLAKAVEGIREGNMVVLAGAIQDVYKKDPSKAGQVSSALVDKAGGKIETKIEKPLSRSNALNPQSLEDDFGKLMKGLE